MKTPMQELFENLDVFLSQGMSYSEWKKLTYGGKPTIEIYLDKEKEVIIQTSVNSYTAGYLDNQAKVDDSMNFPEEYYNETFKTKER